MRYALMRGYEIEWGLKERAVGVQWTDERLDYYGGESGVEWIAFIQESLLPQRLASTGTLIKYHRAKIKIEVEIRH